MIHEIVERDSKMWTPERARGPNSKYGWCSKLRPGAVAVRETPSLIGEIDAGALGARSSRAYG